MKHFRNIIIHRKIYFVLKVVFKIIKHYLSKLSWKREIFVVEVPTAMKNEQDKQKLMADVLEILEHEIKIH
jgi:hypothetical protein|tara:strand:+ start:3458 stop:3670 length:213 start_codon:yes stop_codon:yes gene_type:complete